jgi:GDPmannose 4,6-dehydratase
MWLMVQQAEGDEYVVATGITHSVRELVEAAFARVGLDWEEYVQIDESLVRGNAELHNLVGDPTKAKLELGWEPTVSFEELVHALVDAELDRLRGEAERASA